MSPLHHILLWQWSLSCSAFIIQRRQSIISTSSYTTKPLLVHPSKSTKNSNYDDINVDNQLPHFHHKVSLPDSTYTQILSTVSSSSSSSNEDDVDETGLVTISKKLRLFYDDHFKDPRQPNSNRFIWDPWFVRIGDRGNVHNNNDNNDNNNDDSTIINVQQGEEQATNNQIQYSLKRIQSSTFFTEDDFADLVDELTLLGRSIGLTAITPPWMSLYTNGDLQNFHTDAPQGQMAFVLSLCREGEFEGGETMIMKDNILDYWKNFDGSRGMECGDIFRFIPPTPLGRCIIFDPRVPHGVNRVEGTQDPRRGRVVIHGWFNEPEVCWFGPWGDSEEYNVHYEDDQLSNPAIQEANQILEDAFVPLLQTLGGGEIGRVMGYLAIRMEIDEDGEVVDVAAVCDTLKADWDDYRGIIGYDTEGRPVMEDAVSDVKLTIYETLKSLNFDNGQPGRTVVVPFAFS